MSKAKNDIPRAAIHVGAPAKSFSLAEGNEPERREWDETTYRLKNQDKNNHYDFSRKQLNFEINSKGQIVPLGSNPVPLHERLKQRLDELGFKPYKDKNNPLGNPDNSPNCTVGIIVSGDHDVLARLAFGDQDVDYTIRRSNAGIRLQQGIKDWAMDTYQWACRRWGAENIIAFDVHNDETTPHIHIQTIPVARTKARGRASVKYVRKDDKTKVLSQKEWKKLPEKLRAEYIRTEQERREKESVSYARVWGEDKYAVGRTYHQMHTDYYNEVGRKYGLERGEDISILPVEERRGRVHKNKAVLEAERQAKESIAKSEADKEQLVLQKNRLEGEVGQIQQKKKELDGKITLLMDYADKLDIKKEDLKVPALKTSEIVTDAIKAINGELDAAIPAFKQKEWRAQRKSAIKTILTNMQDEIFKTQELKEKEILELGRSLYNSAMKKTAELIKQNKILHAENESKQKENEELKMENDELRTKISMMDETAISNLRKQKNTEIQRLQDQLSESRRTASYYEVMAGREKKRADNAEELLNDMFSIPKIKEIWSIQQHIRDFEHLLKTWINNAIDAIMAFAQSHLSIFTPEQEKDIAFGIIAEAVRCDLDPIDEEQRKTATNRILDRMNWTGSGLTEGMYNLAVLRTHQLCEEMTVPKELMKNLYLMAGGRGGISTDGGGPSGELTNWDGTKKRTGWGMS
ncbi:MAG: MobV family relaxase [Prevotella sp.]|nr:MobV family relaxase [Prevotella sp.]MDD7127706.1 MobV family relaxase [Prevotella sp.]